MSPLFKVDSMKNLKIQILYDKQKNRNFASGKYSDRNLYML